MKWLDIPPVWLLGTLIIAWIEGQQGDIVDAKAVNALGTLMVVAGIALMVAAVGQMARARTTPIPHLKPNALVSNGIFAWSRNPIYLGDLMVLAGLCLRWEAWVSLILVPVLMMILTRRFIVAEEARLRRGFGAEFDAYCAKTRRWI